MLVIDDDPTVRQLVVAGLEPLGLVCVHEAADGLEGRKILEREAVDVVITDLLMPGLDGMGLMQWAREAKPDIAWIIVSGVETFDAAINAIHNGAFDFLTKPVHVQGLQVAVRNAITQRELTMEKEELLNELHSASQHLLEKVRELEHTTDVVQKDLERAQIIQNALLPGRPPTITGLSIDTLYRPGKNVGGDLYDIVELSKGKLAFYLADATGHGVSAAMLSVLLKQRIIMEREGQALPPGEVLQLVNEFLARDVQAPGLFLTSLYGLLDVEAQELVIASAGHCPALLRRSSGAVERLERTGPALGIEKGASYGETRTTFAPGDRLLVYTDGLVDGSPTQEESLLSQLADTRSTGQESLRQMFNRALSNHAKIAPEEERDDVTVLLIHALKESAKYGRGASHADHQRAEQLPLPAAGEVATPEARSEPPGPLIWMAQSEDELYLAVRGRGTWTHSETFYKLACRGLDSRRRVILDLSACEHLDSTFLGTIHEIVHRGAPGEVTLPCASPIVRMLFEELCMKRVTEALDDRPARPCGKVVPLQETDNTGAAGQRRLLQAHEKLVALSEENRRRFGPLVDAVRRELGEG